MPEASWLNTSEKRRCSLKRCMHCTHGSHALESVSFSSLLPLPLATSLAPRHVPRTSPRPSHLATSLAPRNVPRTSPRPSHLATPLSQRHFYLQASPLSPSTNSPTLSSTPPVTQSLQHCTPATPQDVTTRNPDVMQSIMQKKHMARGHHGGGELDGRNQDEDKWRRRN